MTARINMKIQQKRRKLVKIATVFWIYYKIFDIFEVRKKNARKFNGNVETNNSLTMFWRL